MMFVSTLRSVAEQLSVGETENPTTTRSPSQFEKNRERPTTIAKLMSTTGAKMSLLNLDQISKEIDSFFNSATRIPGQKPAIDTTPAEITATRPETRPLSAK
jgi:hypothetical protein